MQDDIKRNEPCPCGSQKKYKKCCGRPGMAKHAVAPLRATDSLLGRIASIGLPVAPLQGTNLSEKTFQKGNEVQKNADPLEKD